MLSTRTQGRPTRYYRSSELQFISGPAGTGALGTPGTGQAVFFQAPASFGKPFVTGPARSTAQCLRILCRVRVGCRSASTFCPPLPPSISADANARPGQRNVVYDSTGPFRIGWIDDQKSNPLAKNIIALVVQPGAVDKNGDVVRYFSYNFAKRAANTLSFRMANQLAPRVEVTMIAIDEVPAQRLTTGGGLPKIASALQGKLPDVVKSEMDLEEVESLFRLPGSITKSSEG